VRVVPGQQCPWCRVGVVVPRHSSRYGPFLGCTNYQDGAGCRAAWKPDGSRLTGRGCAATAAMIVPALLIALVSSLRRLWLTRPRLDRRDG
jgi:hypothetical protein